jgi:hypothetical protein
MKWREALTNHASNRAQPPGPLFRLARSDEGALSSRKSLTGFDQALLSAPDPRSIEVPPDASPLVVQTAAVLRQRSRGRRAFALAVPAALLPLLPLEGAELRVTSQPHSLAALAGGREARTEAAALAGDPRRSAQVRCLSTLGYARERGVEALLAGEIERDRFAVSLLEGWLGFELRVRHQGLPVLAGGSVFLRDQRREQGGLNLARGHVPKKIHGWERGAGLRVSHADLAVPYGAGGIFDLHDAEILAVELSDGDLRGVVARLLDRWLTHRDHGRQRPELRRLLGL